MTLGFKTEINGKPTYFPEKIIAGLDLSDCEKMTLNDSLGDVIAWTDAEFDAGSCNPLFDHKPKLHTIREDKKGIWKAGNLIHMVIKNCTPDRYQFAPTMKCVSVQTIIIKYSEWYLDFPMVTIDEKEIHLRFDHEQILNQLAVNDGFNDIDHFFNYFDKDFTGKIIHWTDLKY